MTLQEVLNLAKQLSPVDKIRLVQKIAPEIEQDLIANQRTPCQSLWGLCTHLGIAPSAAEIDAVRQDQWANFPREDI